MTDHKRPELGQAAEVTALKAEDLYLDLMKRCLLNYIYDDDTDLLAGAKYDAEQSVFYAKDGGEVCDPIKKMAGQIWPSKAHTMIGLPRLDNIQACAYRIFEEAIPGDFIETGVWRGGATIFMRALLQAYHEHGRRVWVADSFQGIPPADVENYPADEPPRTELDGSKYRDLAVTQQQVENNFSRYGLLDEQVAFLPGWFRETLPQAPIKKLALMRLDGDLYESTMIALQSLYPKLSEGGYVIIDDYNVYRGCREAVIDYREQAGIEAPLWTIPNDPSTGIFWRKG